MLSSSEGTKPRSPPDPLATTPDVLVYLRLRDLFRFLQVRHFYISSISELFHIFATRREYILLKLLLGVSKSAAIFSGAHSTLYHVTAHAGLVLSTLHLLLLDGAFHLAAMSLNHKTLIREIAKKQDTRLVLGIIVPE